jgi:exoribonuclease II
MRRSARDLRALARSIMREEGFEPDVPEDAQAQADALDTTSAGKLSGLADLRALAWSSIDNLESRDLDQLEYAEPLADNQIRLLVAIADVASYVPPRSPIDSYAMRNTSSVYTGVQTFSMLPERLSTDLTSLLEGEDRRAIVIEMTVAPDGALGASAIYPALVHNRAKLDYDTVSAWLAGTGPAPAKVAASPELEQQIHLQDQAAQRLRRSREHQGALEFETIEASVVADMGRVVDLVVKRKGRANQLIESLMIAANISTATFLEQHGFATIQRVVRTPERWQRIVDLAQTYGERLPGQPDRQALSAFLARRKQAAPNEFADLSLAIVKLLGSGEYIVERPDVEVAGHFSLAAQDYTHATAPNRRYVDLVIQRLVWGVVDSQPPPYGEGELATIAAHCDEREGAAAQVERRMRKHAAVDLMSRRIGQRFDAVVTGVAAKGTFARLLAPPVEGRIVRGEQGLDVGDRVQVRLAGVDPERGFIDFERDSF